MMSPDFVNGMFECLAGIMILNHSRVLYRDKQVRGVSKISTLFFSSWGFWNIFYYPSLEQMWSFYGGLVVVSSNCLWLGLMMYYSRKQQEVLA